MRAASCCALLACGLGSQPPDADRRPLQAGIDVTPPMDTIL
jgi:hypothetical protein